MYFVVALVLGQLVSRIRWQERAERRREERSTALYLLTRDLADAADVDDMAQRLVRQVAQAFKAKVAVLLREPGGQPGRDRPSRQHLRRFGERTKRRRVGFPFRQGGRAFHRQSAVGRAPFTCRCKPIAARSACWAWNWPANHQPTLEQRDLLDAFARQAALVLDRLRLDAEGADRRNWWRNRRN